MQDISQPPPSILETLQTALDKHRSGDLDGAAALYAKVLARDPGNFDALHLNGALLRKRGDAAGAVASIERAIAANPARAEDAQLNLANALFDAGRYAPAAAGYARALARNPGDAASHARRGDALGMTGDFAAAEACYRQALALDPADATAWNNLGHALHSLGRPKEALDAANRAIALRQSYAEAHNTAGNALHALDRIAEARDAYARATALKPDFPDAHSNLGNALRATGDPEGAERHYAIALEQRPRFAEAYYNRANLRLDALDTDAAQRDFAHALEIAPDHPMANLNSGLTRLLTGDFAAGWPQYEWRWRDPGLASAKRDFGVPRWTGAEDIAGKRLLVYAEQGFGDTIQFVRYAALAAARGAHVTLEVQAPLKILLAGAAGVATLVVRGEPLPPVDFECPLLSLPRAFGTTLDTIPAPAGYLAADPARAAEWRAKLAPLAGKRVGFVCSGSPTHKNDRNRSIPLPGFIRALEAPGVSPVCLQKELREADRAWLDTRGGVPFFGAELRDFADTAALIAATDLVVSVDTSVAHLAGALGKPVWVLLPRNPDWRWLLGRSDSPWYPSMRLFRQDRAGDWPGVLAAVAAALRGV